MSATATAPRHVCTVSVPWRGQMIPTSILTDGSIVTMSGGTSHRPEQDERDRVEKAIATKYRRLQEQAATVTDPTWLETLNEQMNDLEAGRVALTRELAQPDDA